MTVGGGQDLNTSARKSIHNLIVWLGIRFQHSYNNQQIGGFLKIILYLVLN